jgi:8-amino-7-oxononanoate synthase
MPEFARRFEERLERELNEEKRANRLRRLKQSNESFAHVNFGSNDYLGLAFDESLRGLALEDLQKLPLSSSSSRLLPGNHAEHLEAEERFARFVGSESSLLFNSGFDANHALLSTLPTRHDAIMLDERSHASLKEGAKASHAVSVKFAHNSCEDLKVKIERLRRTRSIEQIFVVVESVYSMDGDCAPLEELLNASRAYEAIVVVDEAHATGVLGTRGEGMVHASGLRDSDVLTVHTCGKALGAAGAFVAGNDVVIRYLVNKARGFMYTTALPPLVARQVGHSFALLEAEGEAMVATLRERSTKVRRELRERLCLWSVPDGVTPIIPIIIGSESATLAAAEVLRASGFDVPAVRPPTVPMGASRLRLNISLRHSAGMLSEVVEAIVVAERSMKEVMK